MPSCKLVTLTESRYECKKLICEKHRKFYLTHCGASWDEFMAISSRTLQNINCSNWISEGLGCTRRHYQTFLQVAANTFQLPVRHLCTWESPSGDTRSQRLDTSSRAVQGRREVTQMYPGADVGSDYNPVFAVVKFHFRPIPQNQKCPYVSISRRCSRTKYVLKWRKKYRNRVSFVYCVVALMPGKYRKKWT